MSHSTRRGRLAVDHGSMMSCGGVCLSATRVTMPAVALIASRACGFSEAASWRGSFSPARPRLCPANAMRRAIADATASLSSGQQRVRSVDHFTPGAGRCAFRSRRLSRLALLAGDALSSGELIWPSADAIAATADECEFHAAATAIYRQCSRRRAAAGRDGWRRHASRCRKSPPSIIISGAAERYFASRVGRDATLFRVNACSPITTVATRWIRRRFDD